MVDNLPKKNIIKLLILSTSLDLGGGDKEMIVLSSNLSKRGYQVKLISMMPLGIMGLEAKHQGLDVNSLNMSRGKPDVRVIPQLIQLINAWQPDILHSNMFHANLLARIVRLFIKIPVLISTAQNIDESHGKKWRDISYQATDFLCDISTNVSKIGVDKYINKGLFSKEKSRFIPNSVDINSFYFKAELRKEIRENMLLGDIFTWLAVGRFNSQKDYPNMINAFALTLKSQPNTLLLIAGEGKLKPEIQKMVENLAIETNIKFLGARRDICALMSAADGYLMSSAWEGMPLVLLEAASIGLPIVTTNVGGTSEIVLDGKTGILVQPKNPKLLAAAMEKIIAMPTEKRLEMGKQGRDYVMNHYSTDKVVTKWEKLYLETLQQHHI